MSRVCVVTTTPFIANTYLRPLLLGLASRHELTLALNQRDGYTLDPELAAKMSVVHVPIARRIAPARDLAALAALRRLFAGGRFGVVHSVAPKAGLLGMLAARAAGVPARIHTFQGEVWATARGWRRGLLKSADRMTARCATHALVVSRGEQAFLEREGVLAPGRSTVLGKGSISGVDTARFHPDPRARTAVRHELGIGEADLVVIYLGRLAREKGVLDLTRVVAAMEGAHLVLAGPDEENLKKDVPGSEKRLHFTGYTPFPERYLAAADVACLPSRREGFGVALIEAGACGLPVLASRLYGTQDAVVEGETGLLHQPGDVADIGRKLAVLSADAALRSRLGRAGRARAEADFRQDAMVQALLDFYSRL
ncbi:MAG TPA: glycosyltransferase [Burkholderiales bacterium]